MKVQVLKIYPFGGHRSGGGVACVLDTLLIGAFFLLVGRERGLKEKKEEGRTKKKVALSSLFPPSTFLSSLAKERAAGKKVGGIQDALSLLSPLSSSANRPPRSRVPPAGRGRVALRRARAHFGTQVNLRSCERRPGARTTARKKGERVRGEGDPGKAQLGDGQREGETGELLIGARVRSR